jgi:hypothetical protein
MNNVCLFQDEIRGADHDKRGVIAQDRVRSVTVFAF